MNSESEHELIARCCRGDAAAWDALFDRHYAAAARFVFQLAPDFSREDVEEICQDTFLTVVKSLSTFRGRSQFQTWLFRIAANKARDFREHQQAAKRGGGQITLSLNAEDPDTGLSLDVPSSQPGPDGDLLRAERFRMVYQGLHQLGPPCQEIIELSYFGDLSYQEIAHSLRLNPKTVSSRLSRCLDRLEDIMRQLLAAETPAPTSFRDKAAASAESLKPQTSLSGRKNRPFSV